MLNVIKNWTDSNTYIKLYLSDCDVVVMSDGAFQGNKHVVSIVLPQTLQIIAPVNSGSAFKNWSVLESVVFPPSLRQMPTSAFDGCSKLKKVDFSACTMLKDTGNSVFQSCAELKTVEWPPALETIGTSAFSGAKVLTVPDFSKMPMLKTIGNNAFKDCFPFVEPGADEDPDLTTIDLSQTSLTTIGNNAFQGCGRIEKVIFPATLESIGNYAFGSTTSAKRVDIKKNACWNLAIPDFSKTPALKSIGTYAFSGCFLAYPPDDLSDPSGKSDLETIDLSQTALTKIDNYAFSGSTRVGKVIFPATLETIGSNVFGQQYIFGNSSGNNDTYVTMVCVNLEDVDFSRCTRLTSISSNAFRNCAKLQQVDLSQTALTLINSNAFQDCASLTTVKLPATLGSDGSGTVNISTSAFAGCKDMTACVLYAEFPPVLGNAEALPTDNDNFKIDVPAQARSLYEKMPTWIGIYNANKGIFLPLDEYVETENF
jgi:hypothetical protein